MWSCKALSDLLFDRSFKKILWHFSHSYSGRIQLSVRKSDCMNVACYNYKIKLSSKVSNKLVHLNTLSSMSLSYNTGVSKGGGSAKRINNNCYNCFSFYKIHYLSLRAWHNGVAQNNISTIRPGKENGIDGILFGSPCVPVRTKQNASHFTWCRT